MSWLLGKLGGMAAKLAVIGGLIVAGLLALLRMQRKAEEAGAAKEKGRQADAWQQTQTKVDQATARIDRLPDDAVRQRLRERAARTAGQGDPVQRRDTTPDGERS